MTTVAGVARPVVARRWAVWSTALLLPIGPAAVAVLRYVLPYDTVDDSSTMVSKAIAEPGRASLVLWLGFVAVLTLVPAAYAVGRMTRSRAPQLTAAAMVLLVPGYLALGWLAAADQLLWIGPEAGFAAREVTRLYDAAHPTTEIAEVLFVVGHVIGTILLGIALWRSQVVPRWAAVAVIVSQPIHIVAAVVVPNHTLDLIGWGLQAAGFAAVGWAIVRRVP
ncbi:hypothetical protein BWI15_14115 [Kribbella sp. ALI-6-A]|uniref:DUF4386 family protein n=1 Tax=Kribbella sp. ALI-6-A TaxID=1933817 RepID=UPI00097C7A23|nr:DUF4386 family protein [Kribbella sp. ALI-6-A]ONI74440.1 hypothetical protein BWI15_14115 [Kribbella sp. ALI-6-A]